MEPRQRTGAAAPGAAGRPDIFVGAVTEKMLIYALGRGLTAADMPVVRSIVRNAARNGLSIGVNCVGDRSECTVPDADE